MQKRIILSVCCAVVFLIFSQCAQVGLLSGGNRDLTPPKLKEAIPANKSSNFHEQEIILKFDE